MAPNGEVSGLRTALAMGAAKGVLVSDPELQGSDALTTAKVLAAAIGRLGDFDLVIAGTESSDGYTGTVPEQIAEVLGLPSVTFAKHIVNEGGTLKVDRQTESGLRRGVLPAAGRRQRHRRRGRAPLPELQGHHGRQVEAGRGSHRRRPRRHRRWVGPAPARRSSTSPPPPSVRPARSSRTTARRSRRSWPTSRTSRFSEAPGRRRNESERSMAVSNIWVLAQVADGEPSSATLELVGKARTIADNVTAFVDRRRRRRGGRARRARSDEGLQHG